MAKNNQKTKRIITNQIIELSEDHDHVLVVTNDREIIDDYLYDTPGRKHVRLSPSLYGPSREETNKVIFVGDCPGYVARSANISFVLPQKKFDLFDTDCIVFIPPIIPNNFRIFAGLPSLEDFIFIKDFSRLINQGYLKNVYRKITSECAGYKAILYDYYRFDSLVQAFHADSIAFNFNLRFPALLSDEEAIKKVEYQFNMLPGSVLSEGHLQVKTWLHEKQIRAILECLIDCGFVKRFYDLETKTAMYHMPEPIVMTDVNRYVQEASEDMSLYMDLMGAPQARIDQFMTMKIQQHCLEKCIKAVLFDKLGQSTTVDLIGKKLL